MEYKNSKNHPYNYSLKGNICCSSTATELCIAPDSYVICENGICLGVYRELPESLREFPCYDYGDSLIIPGLVDLHVHAPQYPFRGLGMDKELIEWLNAHTFPEEAKYADITYAEKAYDIFTGDLLGSATTRACIFGTIHRQATLLLMEKLERSGIKAYVGKVNMDRNSPENLRERDAKSAVEDTQRWIEQSLGFQHVKPILTPRFIPACSDELMRRLADLQKKYGLPVQSHLSENLGEVQWVGELCPEAAFYGEAYDRYGMFGGGCPTVMAHCVHSSEAEIQMMKRNRVFAAHCPESNANLSSGIAPVRAYLEEGLQMGLGSDVAGGNSLFLFYSLVMAGPWSKLRWGGMDSSLAPLTIEEVFYLATKGGGAFFGKVGSFEKGYEFDAVVLDDSTLRHPQELSVRERLERIIYLGDDRHIAAKYIGGRQVMSRELTCVSGKD